MGSVIVFFQGKSTRVDLNREDRFRRAITEPGASAQPATGGRPGVAENLRLRS
jgi:hypothetical protein